MPPESPVAEPELKSVQPSIPDELWMLFYAHSGEPVVSYYDGPRNGETFLVAKSRAEAEAAAQYQMDEYEIENITVARVR